MELADRFRERPLFSAGWDRFGGGGYRIKLFVTSVERVVRGESSGVMVGRREVGDACIGMCRSNDVALTS